MCGCMCWSVYTRAQVCCLCGGQGSMPTLILSSSIASPTFFVETGSLIETGGCCLVRLAGQLSQLPLPPALPCPPPPPSWDINKCTTLCPAFYVDSADPNSDPYACFMLSSPPWVVFLANLILLMKHNKDDVTLCVLPSMNVSVNRL